MIIIIKSINFKNYLHFNNKRTIHELKRFLKILFLKTLRFPVSHIFSYTTTVGESLLASGQPITR